jgi:hypothetical protein
MLRLTIWFYVGMLLTALLVNALSVYVFHDVDQEMIGHWNAAYFLLDVEFAIMSFIISGFLLLFISVGRKFFYRHGGPLNIRLGIMLGIGTILFQYAFDMAARSWVPGITMIVLCLYPLLSSAASAIILLRKTSPPKASISANIG